MLKKNQSSSGFLLYVLTVLCIGICVRGLNYEDGSQEGPLVKKQWRETVAKTENGEISAIKISDGINGIYNLQFITLEPNSVFLPVLLHADMVFYVKSGRGTFNVLDEDNEVKEKDVKRGDVYRLEAGSVFFVQSSLESTREKLRINAIFTNPIIDNPQLLQIGPYSTLSELIMGFDEKVLQAAFGVSDRVIKKITRTGTPPQIVHVPSKSQEDHFDFKNRIMQVITGSNELNKKHKKKKGKAFNILDQKPDFENCFGWTTAVTKKNLHALKGSNVGVFMVNLTQEAMLGPHWNPWATEIAVVTHGRGMVHVVCPSLGTDSKCKNMKFKVKEGDVFAIPRFHPMTHMSFMNDSFVFMGFSTMAKKNHPQFLAGKSSVLNTLDKNVLAMSFNVPKTTLDQLLSSQEDSIIVRCQFCAEDEEKKLEEEVQKEIQKRRQEEERKRKEEEARKRAKEEAKRKKEEEEARKREEEAKKKREEEEAKKREEEEAKKREEEEERKREEEAARERERQEEEARKQEEEEERKRQEEEARREEEEKQRKEKEAEEARKKEAARRRKQQEAARRREEDRRRRQAEQQRRQEEEEERQRRQEEQEEEAERMEEERQREQERRRGGGWRKIFMMI